MSKKIKIGDNVIVITGKDKGKTGEVFIIDRKNLKAKVRGINIVKKHNRSHFRSTIVIYFVS